LAIIALVLVAVSTRGSGDQQQPSQKDEQFGPPIEVCSRDSKYCVRMIRKSGHPDDCTLRLSSSGRTLAEFPTLGYLLDVFFSSDNRYVAINNRRANSGDYLWVISLRDGQALKIPDDVADEPGKKELGKISGDHWSDQAIPEVVALCPKCTVANLGHGFLFARGWKSASALKVAEEFEFPEGWIVLNSVCQITGPNLSVIEHKIEKESRPSELVRRAWTWSPFHSD